MSGVEETTVVKSDSGVDRASTSVANTREEAVKKMREHYVEVLMGQTTWERDEATEKLGANGYNVQACVRLFMGLPAVPSQPRANTSSTTNQAIYGNIRGMMDEASRRYERKKEIENRIQMAREAYQQAHSTAVTTSDDTTSGTSN